ncbi:type II toxin-antitoxin system RelE/ParE family toxin [Enterococcus durans]|uniref:type II toxin-antitoxin system RelE/ParE family toxin n=1 Tax=Enterococcus durans TaxID=53345 RepID=UPI00115A5544|nr:type II toxin-antitoxin system RelE/ParE family toxin [Enterococcus durans]EGP5009698.1 hypothetical protein [Enterococcus faecium]MCH3632463.1 type II toxin-antitoxin system RelE/ParE family toxin [Enterococcus faecium]HAQ3896398.1 hypothetical protein [Enterococcus faecium]
MIVRARKRKLQKILADSKLINLEFGKQIGDKVKQRIAELLAAETLEDISHLPPMKLHSLSGEYEGCFAVKLTGNFRLVFKAYTCEEEFTTQKSNTEIIVIEEVVDYHGK